MAGRMFANWWTQMKPYYADANKEMFLGFGILVYVYYKMSFPSKKAALKDKPAH